MQYAISRTIAIPTMIQRTFYLCRSQIWKMRIWVCKMRLKHVPMVIPVHHLVLSQPLQQQMVKISLKLKIKSHNSLHNLRFRIYKWKIKRRSRKGMNRIWMGWSRHWMLNLKHWEIQTVPQTHILLCCKIRFQILKFNSN